MKYIILALLLSFPCFAQVVRQNGINESNSNLTFSTLTVTNSGIFTNGPLAVGTSKPVAVMTSSYSYSGAFSGNPVNAGLQVLDYVAGSTTTIIIGGNGTGNPLGAIVYGNNTAADNLLITPRNSNSQANGLTLDQNGNVGIDIGVPLTTLQVNGSASFGGNVHQSTMSSTGIFVPPTWTLAQLAIYTPTAAELGGIVICANCAVPRIICQSTGTTLAGFALSTFTVTGQSPCR